MKIPFKTDSKLEIDKIVSFFKKIKRKTGINKVVIGLSGGIDSTSVFFLLKQAYDPKEIFPAILNFNPKDNRVIKSILAETKIPKENIFDVSIKPAVERVSEILAQEPLSDMRKGNIMARIRMIILFDLAKKNGALVCGTENKSEHLLGYFTRFGDAASDIEPITHLYKTQVYQLAKDLGVPKTIINQPPSADLWEKQTDEGEFGFTYKEADQVLHLYYDKKIRLEKIGRYGFKHYKKIIERLLSNQFKLKTPYFL